MARIAASGRVASTRTNNLLYNSGFEVAPSFIAATNTALRWIDGTAGGSQASRAYGWSIPSGGITASASTQFDTSFARSGTTSMKLSTLNSSGAISVSSFKNVAAPELFPLTAGATYTLNGYIRTNNVVTNGTFIDIREYSATATTVTTNSSTKLSGTDTSFRQVTVTFTANASTRFGGILLRLNVTGNTADAWFDDITLVPASIGRIQASGRIAA